MKTVESVSPSLGTHWNPIRTQLSHWVLYSENMGYSWEIRKETTLMLGRSWPAQSSDMTRGDVCHRLYQTRQDTSLSKWLEPWRLYHRDCSRGCPHISYCLTRSLIWCLTKHFQEVDNPQRRYHRRPRKSPSRRDSSSRWRPIHISISQETHLAR